MIYGMVKSMHELRRPLFKFEIMELMMEWSSGISKIELFKKLDKLYDKFYRSK
jgi:hypothetical protein